MSAKKYEHNFHLPILEAIEKGSDLIDAIPELAAYPEFSTFKGKELNKIIAFVFYAYDPGSGFIAITDTEKRKELALKEAGLHTVDSAIRLRIPDILAVKDRQFQAMLTRFFKSIVQDDEFEEWVSAKEFVSQLNENVRNGVDSSELKADAEGKVYKIKADNLKEIPIVNVRIKELSASLFKGDKVAMKALGNEINRLNIGLAEELFLDHN